ncbi:uncharacterized protein [Spinacia oleracea]|uniref:Reverse transcriptase zinc-binding domain-containing protein n=1 Tax=Spinacia oleracea TaxID=3562 RepID=A0ABM3R419_SPIOL|nr:uncharacterized protein LOC130465573 [Spinacia oleracea]
MCKQIFFSGQYSIRKMYQGLLGQFPKVQWRRVLCNSSASPKSLFILWLALHGRLPTKDRILQWGIVTDGLCSLCGSKLESTQHLFFQCSFSKKVWQKFLQGLHISRAVQNFDQEIQFPIRMSKNTIAVSKLFLAGFAETVYGLWLQRNQRVFAGHIQTAEQISRDVIFRVACRYRDSDLHLLLF